ncbi:cytochrome P450 2D17 [Tupaia chinensis]|uniref:cytochrome P450 2D17 n=1 Tax=Tupaia chinensis TaxID=246437 RepID=UPI000704492D|nr:cytochrome P450 2D17 [Tupaia chinensis]
MGLLTGDTLMTLALAGAVFLLLLDLMHRRSRWAARYPPGPTPLPGLGNLLQLDFQDTPKCFNQLRRRFGDVFSLQLAWTPVVVLNGQAAIREALVNCGEDTSDRPPSPIYEHLGFGPRSQGVILARYGPAWQEQRRFSLSTLRNFGLGKKSLEQWVTEEAAYLCAAFADQAGHPFRPDSLLSKAVSNVIAFLTFGHRFEYDDERFFALMRMLDEGLKEESGFLRQVLNEVPVLLRIPGVAKKVFSGQKAFMAMMEELVNEHRTTRDPDQPPRDLTDAFLTEVEKAKGNPESSFNEENLLLVVADLFSAGMVTTSTTLAWALLLMILHPDVQRESSGGSGGEGRRNRVGGSPGVGWIQSVAVSPWWQGSWCPQPRAHSGQASPAQGTTLFTNLSSVLKDEKLWEKPFHFHPAHFLDAQGRFVKPEAFIPFSAGRRTCLGEPLARMELFLFFTCLLQRFSFSVPPGQPPPSDHGQYAFLVTPAPFQLCAVPR